MQFSLFLSAKYRLLFSFTYTLILLYLQVLLYNRDEKRKKKLALPKWVFNGRKACIQNRLNSHFLSPLDQNCRFDSAYSHALTYCSLVSASFRVAYACSKTATFITSVTFYGIAYNLPIITRY